MKQLYAARTLPLVIGARQVAGQFHLFTIHIDKSIIDRCVEELRALTVVLYVWCPKARMVSRRWR